MTPVKRITMVISSMEAGGAERVMSIMVNHWAARSIEITLLVLTGSPSFYDLDPRIKYVALGIDGRSGNPAIAALNNVKRIFTLRRAIRQSAPELVISFIDTTNVLVILATRGLGAPVIVSEHNNPAMWDVGWIWNRLRSFTYPFADKVVLLSERARSYYPKKVQYIAVVIPNPVSPGAPQNSALKKPMIMAAGRFGYEKGFDILLKAFAIVRDKHPEWSLTILGDGALRDELEALRHRLNLDKAAQLPGRVKNMTDFLQRSRIFVLSSRTEGFPMALCEAMASGLCVISFDCETGPGEIITDGKDGILVPREDVAAMANAIDRVIGDEALRESIASSAVQITDRYGVEKVMAMWEKLIVDLVKKIPCG